MLHNYFTISRPEHGSLQRYTQIRTVLRNVSKKKQDSQYQDFDISMFPTFVELDFRLHSTSSLLVPQKKGCQERCTVYVQESSRVPSVRCRSTKKEKHSKMGNSSPKTSTVSTKTTALRTTTFIALRQGLYSTPEETTFDVCTVEPPSAPPPPVSKQPQLFHTNYNQHTIRTQNKF